MDSPENWMLVRFLRYEVVVPIRGQVPQPIRELDAEFRWLVSILLLQKSAPEHRLVRVAECLRADFDPL